MDITKYLKLIWSILDGVLLLAIFVMMAVLTMAPAEIRGEKSDSSRRYERDAPRFQSSVRYGSESVSVAPVAYERERSAQIARNMVVSESVQLPVRPAMDMREKDKTYEVRFALPSGSDENDVNVKVNGNILTLLLETDEKAFMRRIRIPCDYARNSSLNHFVSNHVLYVQITSL